VLHAWWTGLLEGVGLWVGVGLGVAVASLDGSGEGSDEGLGEGLHFNTLPFIVCLVLFEMVLCSTPAY